MDVEVWFDEGMWLVSVCEPDMGEVEQMGHYENAETAWKLAQKIAKARGLKAVRRDRSGQIVAVVRVRVRGAA